MLLHGQVKVRVDAAVHAIEAVDEAKDLLNLLRRQVVGKRLLELIDQSAKRIQVVLFGVVDFLNAEFALRRWWLGSSRANGLTIERVGAQAAMHNGVVDLLLVLVKRRRHSAEIVEAVFPVTTSGSRGT